MNVAEWKESTRKKFTLASGLEVVVRRLSPFALNSVGGLPGVDMIPADRQAALTESILQHGLLSPKIGEGPEEISKYDLSVEEVNEIVEAIVGTTKGGASPEGVPLDGTA